MFEFCKKIPIISAQDMICNWPREVDSRMVASPEDSIFLKLLGNPLSLATFDILPSGSTVQHFISNSFNMGIGMYLSASWSSYAVSSCIQCMVSLIGFLDYVRYLRSDFTSAIPNWIFVADQNPHFLSPSFCPLHHTGMPLCPAKRGLYSMLEYKAMEDVPSY